jgi:hypothetical protein
MIFLKGILIKKLVRNHHNYSSNLIFVLFKVITMNVQLNIIQLIIT